MPSNTKPNPIVTGLFHGGRKVNISLLFITQSYFAVSKTFYAKFYTYFITEIPDKQEPWEIAFNQSADLEFKDFINLYNKCTTKTIFLFSY